jgi:hypothetical protein
MSQVDRLPSRFPNGTRYVIEGRDGRILLRYLEFPDGRQISLPANLGPPPKRRASAQRRSRK